MRQTLKCVVIALVFSTVLGCPPPPINGKDGPCKKVGQQCQLGSGALGVCMRRIDSASFDCIPQH